MRLELVLMFYDPYFFELSMVEKKIMVYYSIFCFLIYLFLLQFTVLAFKYPLSDLSKLLW